MAATPCSPQRARNSGAGIDLPHGSVQAGARDLYRDLTLVKNVHGLLVLRSRLLGRRTASEDLHEVRVREHVDEPAAGQSAQLIEVATPDVADRPVLPRPRLEVDRLSVDDVHRADQVVPWIRLECLRELLFPPLEPVDLERELHRQAPALRFDHSVDVGLEIVSHAVSLVWMRDEALELAEVVEVLGEADLVDAMRSGRVDISLDRGCSVLDRALFRPCSRATEVHVVVDDHRLSSASTSSRSSAVVTLTRRLSPSTILTRPPLASTNPAQSVSDPVEPARARRKVSATNACGV